MTTETILEELKSTELLPTRLSEILQFLVSEYGRKSAALSIILMRKSLIWTTIRKDTKSDTSADREYAATEDGKKEISLRLEIKVLEKIMSAIKVRISVLQGEARNIF